MSEVWMGGGFYNPYLPLGWTPGAIINARMGNSQPGNPRAQLGRMPLGTGDSFPATALRVTQAVADVLRNTDPEVRVTRLGVDVLRNVDSEFRVTQVGLEVLRSTAFGSDFSVSATTGLEIVSAGAKATGHWFAKSATTGLELGIQGFSARVLFVSATTGLDIASRGSGLNTRIFTKSATTGIDMIHSNSKFKWAAGVATSAIIFGSRARDAGNPNLPVSASTVMNVGSLGDFFINRAYNVNAATGINVGLVTSERANFKKLAATGISILSTGDGRLPIVFASATTAILIGSVGQANVPRTINVSASTLFTIGNVATATNTSKYVTATTQMRLGLATTKFKLGPIFVHATTIISMKNVAGKSMNFARRVSAHTGINLGSRAVMTQVNRALLASASTRITIGASAIQVRDVHSSASTVLEIGAGAISNGRDIYVSATTSMEMGRDADTNQFIRIHETSIFELQVIATAIVGGTPAETGLVFTHRADAEVWLPWRRASLTLPPGGQLPHSG